MRVCLEAKHSHAFRPFQALADVEIGLHQLFEMGKDSRVPLAFDQGYIVLVPCPAFKIFFQVLFHDLADKG